jgi:Fe-S oxidoreductase
VTDLDFGPEGGFEAAVDLCNGNGACRRLDEGSMCPSFMATREEKDSTRGRANVLRLAMAGRLGDVALNDKEVYGVMDLCVQCKACKTECPSAVDMAKLKTEWLGRYWKRHPVPVRTQLFAHLPRAARLASGILAPFVNGVAASRPVRWMLDRYLGIDRSRTLPVFARRPYATGWPSEPGTSRGKRVVLFADTFHNHHYPAVARAAHRFLDSTGYAVIPVGDVCCGRTYLSKGFITQARDEAVRTVNRLWPLVQDGLPVVGLEPSCILTLTDEFRALLPGDERVAAIADAAVTFEQFEAGEADAGRLDHVVWRTDVPDVLVHGHCHQKALTGMDPSLRCLGLPGGNVQGIEAGCCGMAGAFGYEKEHLDVSYAMAEDRLAPAVRAAPVQTSIVAAGTSCRAQIHDVTGRTSQHPAQFLAEALADQQPA